MIGLVLWMIATSGAVYGMLRFPTWLQRWAVGTNEAGVRND